MRSTQDRILTAKLAGTAGRHVAARTPTDQAATELRTLADGRTDLLAHVAGTAIAAAEKADHPPWKLREAELCIAAGADETLIPAATERTRAVLSRGLITT